MPSHQRHEASWAPELSRPLTARNEITSQPQVTSVYEAGSQTRRTLGWRAPTVSPNAALVNLSTLRDRSRTAVRNNGYAKGTIDKLVSNIIGWGLKPLSQAADPEFRQRVHALWVKWDRECSTDYQLSWSGIQTQTVRAWLEGGDCFVRMRDRYKSDVDSVPLQLEVLEPELCPYTYDGRTKSGNRIRAGIEFNAIGQRVRYWFHPSRPGDFQDFDASQLVPVDADKINHIYDPLRPGQLRGIPHLTQALIRLNELDKFTDATLLRQQIANLFVAFIKRDQGIGEGESVHPLTGLPANDTQDDRPVLTMEPGVLQELAPGEDMTFSDPPDVGSTYADFVRLNIREICSATGVPYEVLTGDLKDVNDRSVRVILNEFRRMIQRWQYDIVAHQLCQPVWEAWMARAILSGALPEPLGYADDPYAWYQVKWMPQRWQYLNPVQDVEAEQAQIRAGFTSRAAVVSEHGEDAEAIDAEQASDNARADGLALQYDSDGRKPLKASAPAPPQPAETPPQNSVPKVEVHAHVDARPTYGEGAFKFVDKEEHIHEAPVAVETIVEKQIVRNEHGRADGVIERHIPQHAS